MVFLINLPFKGQDQRKIQSLGMGYLAAELIEQQYEVKIFDGCGVDREAEKTELIEELLLSSPDYIGFYVVEHNYDETISFINHLPTAICADIFLGGPQVAFLARQIMEEQPRIKFILIGESEGKLEKIFNHDFSVNGLVYREGTQIVETPIKCDNRNLNELLFPVREINGKCLLTKENYNSKSYYVVPISSSRGCPYNCSFCSVPAMMKSQAIQWRFRSAESIGNEIRDIYQNNKNLYIRFIDDNFLVNIDRALDICHTIKGIGEIPFSFAGRVNAILSLTESQIVQMKECGVTAIEIGIENFNNHVLLRYKKQNTAAQAIAALEKLIKYNIYPAIDFIMFDPWTTINELKTNYYVIVELGLDSYDPPFLTNRLYPFPGTEYYKTIDMDHYFINSDVEKVYYKILNFIKIHGEYRKKLLAGTYKKYILQAYLSLPYKVFGILLNNPDISLDSIELIGKFEECL